VAPHLDLAPQRPCGLAKIGDELNAKDRGDRRPRIQADRAALTELHAAHHRSRHASSDRDLALEHARR
jgi:hypothetical protein